MHMHCEGNPITLKLINTSITSQLSFCGGVRTFKVYSLGKFQVYSTVLSTLVTKLYIRSSDLIHLVGESWESGIKLSSQLCRWRTC